MKGALAAVGIGFGVAIVLFGIVFIAWGFHVEEDLPGRLGTGLVWITGGSLLLYSGWRALRHPR